MPRAHRHYDCCDSTNDIARAWILDPAEPAPHGALVTGDLQTRGRGRRGRTWDARAGESVLMSYIVRPDDPLDHAPRLGFVAALAVVDALAEEGLAARLKWPNDVLLGDRKTAGILVEVVPSLPHGGWAAVIGIGVNVNQERFDGGDAYQTPPTSLRLESGVVRSPAAVAARIAAALDGHGRLLRRDDGFEEALRRWRIHLAVGATVTRGDRRAALLGLGPSGSALVRLADGTFAEWTTVEGEERANSV